MSKQHQQQGRPVPSYAPPRATVPEPPPEPRVELAPRPVRYSLDYMGRRRASR